MRESDSKRIPLKNSLPKSILGGAWMFSKLVLPHAEGRTRKEDVNRTVPKKTGIPPKTL